MKTILLFLFIVTNLIGFGQRRTYPTTITLNNGNVSYCQNASSTQLTITLGTVQCGSTGSNTNVTHTEKIFVNTVNSTIGGTQVATLSNAIFTTNATYTPPTNSFGILYYYAVVEWVTNGCATGGSITSSVVSVEVLTQNSTIPFSQGFNGGSCGWTTQQVSGTAGAITNVSSGTNETTTPFEGAGFIQFNSYSCTAGNSTRLQSPDITVGTNEDIEITFHWRNSTTGTYSTNLDRVVVQWYDGSTWIDIQTYNRPNATLNGWQEKTCQFNTGNKTTIKIGFRFISEYGYNCALDNLIVSKIETPLPVELLYFEGTKHLNFNCLKWGTASEQNSSHFHIEKSNDGDNWSVIGEKQSVGNSQSVITYHYLDYNIQTNTVYYRLIQYDFNGDFEIFDPIVIEGVLPDKKIIQYYNILGQEVDENHKGVILILYDDKTIKKIIR